MLGADEVRFVMREVMSASMHVTGDPCVAILAHTHTLAPPSHAALTHRLGSSVRVRGLGSVCEMLSSLRSGESSYALIPATHTTTHIDTHTTDPSYECSYVYTNDISDMCVLTELAYTTYNTHTYTRWTFFLVAVHTPANIPSSGQAHTVHVNQMRLRTHCATTIINEVTDLAHTHNTQVSFGLSDGRVCSVLMFAPTPDLSLVEALKPLLGEHTLAMIGLYPENTFPDNVVEEEDTESESVNVPAKESARSRATNVAYTPIVGAVCMSKNHQ